MAASLPPFTDDVTATLVTHLDHFQHRVIQDALADATSIYWTRRAEAFEAARPRPGDYPGKATLGDLRAADVRCREAAEACRKRARVAVMDRIEDVA